MILEDKIKTNDCFLRFIAIPKQTGRKWVKIRREILEFFNYTCQKCKISFTKKDIEVPYRKRVLEIHHIQPIYENGLNSFENLTVLCRKCHKFYTTQTKRKQILDKKLKRKIDKNQRKLW